MDWITAGTWGIIIFGIMVAVVVTWPVWLVLGIIIVSIAEVIF